MGFSPTASQKKAILTIDRDVAVTAGAGSGKTRVLVERYLNLLQQGVLMEEIAAITFTKKAAQEMKERLRTRGAHLAGEIEGAQISTIHSLCQRIIQEHPLQAAIDPRFRLGEEWEVAVLLKQAVAEALNAEEGLLELGPKDKLATLVESLYKQMLTKSDLRFQQNVPGQKDYHDELQELAAAVEDFLQEKPSTDRQRTLIAAWKREWPLLQGSLFSGNEEFELEAVDILEGYVKGFRGGLALKTKRIKTTMSLLKDHILQNRGGRIIARLGNILEATHGAYQAKKTAQGILDYNDLEHLAYSLLQDKEIRSHYNFRHVMVDEFQDTNPLQKKIVDCLVGGGARLFVVGDPKQSIYRFRGAEVEVFLQSKREIEARGQIVFLEDNFRSRPELIEFTNHFFAQLMQDEAISFQANSANKEPKGGPAINVLLTPAQELTLQEGRVLEAQQIALKIKELVQAGHYKYEEISLLFRVMTNVRIYEQALQAAGIPYVNLSGRGFYSRQEIQDILNYFAWLEDAGNELARFAVLRSPFYLISDAGLYWIRNGRRENLSFEEQEALRRSGQDYALLQRLILEKPAPVVIRTMLDLTAYLPKTWRLLFGPQRVANVEKLLAQSWEFYARNIVSVGEQLRYIRLAAQEGEREGEALLDAEHADVVVLRTIHGAKGLEFPVVFLPDTNGKLTASRGGEVLYHPDYGLTYKGLASYEALKKQSNAEEASEAKRLLYVAVTRAEEEVFWCALDGIRGSDNWWQWLQQALPDTPSELYQIIPGDQPWPAHLERAEPDWQETIPRFQEYEPLAAQYQQVSFSVTALMGYARCPRCYYYRYILGVPEEALASERAPLTGGRRLTALQRGNIVHRVCELITNPSQLSPLIDYAASMEGITLTAGEKGQLARIITPYLKSGFFARVANLGGQWEIHQEKEFALEIDKFVITGMVDQVFVGEAGIEIVDFKSNWIKREQVAEVGASYDVQLRLYAWAMAREFQKPVLRTQAYFLIPNEVYTLKPELLNVEETDKWLARTCQEIIRGAQEGLAAFPSAPDCLSCQRRAPFAKTGAFGENRGEIARQDVKEELM